MRYVGPILAAVCVLVLINSFLNSIAHERGDLFISLSTQDCWERAGLKDELRHRCLDQESRWQKLNRRMSWWK